jgi:hypothetical protein
MGKECSQDNKDLLGMFVQCRLVTKIEKLRGKGGGLAVGQYRRVPFSLSRDFHSPMVKMQNIIYARYCLF